MNNSDSYLTNNTPNQKLYNLFLLGFTVVHEPNNLPHSLIFNIIHESLGIYFWVKGFNHHTPEAILQRSHLSAYYIQKIQDKIEDLPPGWRDIVLNQYNWIDKTGKITGFQYKRLNEERIATAWRRVTNRLWIECGNSLDNWAEFKLTRLETKYKENPQYLVQRRNNLLGYVKYVQYSLGLGLTKKNIQKISKGFSIEVFDQNSSLFQALMNPIYPITLDNMRESDFHDLLNSGIFSENFNLNSWYREYFGVFDTMNSKNTNDLKDLSDLVNSISIPPLEETLHSNPNRSITSSITPSISIKPTHILGDAVSSDPLNIQELNQILNELQENFNTDKSKKLKNK